MRTSVHPFWGGDPNEFFVYIQLIVIFYKYIKTCIGGSVVEFSPATREARVRFPADAELLPLWTSGEHDVLGYVVTREANWLAFCQNVKDVAMSYQISTSCWDSFVVSGQILG